MNSMLGKGGVFMLAATFVLAAEPIPVQRSEKKAIKPPVQLMLEWPSKSILVGEAVDCTIRLRYDPQRADIQGVSLVPWDETLWKIEYLKGPEKKREAADCFELVWTERCIPLKAGRQIVPGFQAEIALDDDGARRGIWGGFFFTRSTKKLQTDETAVQVQPIPVRGNCLGVGTYTRAELFVDRHQLTQGEALQVTCRLLGQGSAGLIGHFTPAIPPDAVAHVEGIKRDQREGGVVDFSFIVQLKNAGEVTFPVQQFLLYDPLNKRAYTLSTNELTVTVEPRSALKKSALAEIASEDDLEEGEEPDDGELPTYTPSVLRSVEIPLWLFVLLLGAVLMGGLFVLLRVKCTHYLKLIKRYFVWRWERFFIRWQVRSGKATGAQLYAYFERYPLRPFLPEEQRPAWDRFWEMLLEHRFAQERGDKVALCAEACLWLRSRTGFPKRAWVFMGVVLFFRGAVSLGGEATESSAHKINALRILQKTASTSEFCVLESSINALKRESVPSASSGNRWSEWEFLLLKCTHLLPFVIWQLLLILGLAMLFWRPRIRTGLLVVVSCVAVIISYRERTTEWRVLTEQTNVHLGPGITYPVLCVLSPLEEIAVRECVLSQGYRWLRVDCVGRSGWIISQKDI